MNIPDCNRLIGDMESKLSFWRLFRKCTITVALFIFYVEFPCRDSAGIVLMAVYILVNVFEMNYYLSVAGVHNLQMHL